MRIKMRPERADRAQPGRARLGSAVPRGERAGKDTEERQQRSQNVQMLVPEGAPSGAATGQTPAPAAPAAGAVAATPEGGGKSGGLARACRRQAIAVGGPVQPGHPGHEREALEAAVPQIQPGPGGGDDENLPLGVGHRAAVRVGRAPGAGRRRCGPP